MGGEGSLLLRIVLRRRLVWPLRQFCWRPSWVLEEIGSMSTGSELLVGDDNMVESGYVVICVG